MSTPQELRKQARCLRKGAKKGSKTIKEIKRHTKLLEELAELVESAPPIPTTKRTIRPEERFQDLKFLKGSGREGEVNGVDFDQYSHQFNGRRPKDVGDDGYDADGAGKYDMDDDFLVPDEESKHEDKDVEWVPTVE